MFDIGMTEMLMIAVVAIIVVGPKDLPGMLRNIGKYVGQIRGMAREFQGQMDNALKEAELDGVKNTLDDIRNMNPVNQIKSEVSDYMDSARAFDEPDETITPAKTAEPIDSGAATGTEGKTATKAPANDAKPAGDVNATKAEPAAETVSAPDTTATDEVKARKTSQG